MIPEECAALVAIVSQVCPSQKFNEYTPDAWLDVIGHLSFDDCREAVRNLARRLTYIGPADITSEVRRIREDRGNRHQGVYFKPSRGDLSVAQQIAELKAFNKALADGKEPPHREALTHPVDILALGAGLPKMPSAADDEQPYRPSPSNRARALDRARRERAEQQ